MFLFSSMNRCISLIVSLVFASINSRSLVAILVASTVPKEVANIIMKIWDRLLKSICTWFRSYSHSLSASSVLANCFVGSPCTYSTGIVALSRASLSSKAFIFELKCVALRWRLRWFVMPKLFIILQACCRLIAKILPW